jgi:hypothetical protein
VLCVEGREDGSDWQVGEVDLMKLPATPADITLVGNHHPGVLRG